jgi:hypothetical protein
MTPTFAYPPNLHAFHAQDWDVTRQFPRVSLLPTGRSLASSHRPAIWTPRRT